MSSGEGANINDMEEEPMSDDEVVELFEDEMFEFYDIQEMAQFEQVDSDEEEEKEQRTQATQCTEGDSEFVFQKHKGAVFCCALDPINGNLAVTGGEDDMAYVWVIQTGEIVFQCDGHQDSVTMVGFSYDGKYLATGDMTGLIHVWNVATKEKVCSNVPPGSDMNWMQWHHGTRALLHGHADGTIYMWRVKPGHETPSVNCKIYGGNYCSTGCAVIMPDGQRLAVGFADGGVKMYNLKSGQVLGDVAAGQANSQNITCIDAHYDNQMIATGGCDGKVSLLKTQPLKVIWSYDCNEHDDKNTITEAIGFSKDSTLPLLAVGTLSSKLFIFDFSRQVIRHRFKLEAGICRLLWDRQSSILFVAGLNGIIQLYNARSGKHQSSLQGHNDIILDIFLSMDGNTLISASEDATSRVFAISRPDR